MAARKIKRGLFITFDGPEGCGKTTQSRALALWLRRRGFSVVLTRDPGGSPIAEEIRDLLLDHRHKGLDPLSEMLLYETCRASLVRDVILPALRRGKIVVCDRFSDATHVYQGVAGGVPDRLIQYVDKAVCRGVTPILTFILDVESRKGLKRLRRHRKLDRMEKKPLRFHEAVRRGYARIAKKNPARVKLIPPLPLEKVKEKIVTEVTRALRRHFRAGPAGRVS